ncbi:ABC transporter permease [Nocardioides dubius]|uniref:ABC transporter permease n=1 Tax=Nocardioides dubius TaxID=317019 RepID=A0ABN1TKQ2_9ACTN
MSVATTAQAPAAPARKKRRSPAMWLLIVAAVIAVISLVRIVTGTHELDSPGSLTAAITATCPILLAALGGLWAERAGVVNIGLEGQMILGTWGAAYFTYWYDPYTGIIGAIALGAVGGLIHAIATVSFGVNHIVSGVAINLIGLGLASFLAEAFFADLNSEHGRGGPRQLTGLAKPDTITIPGFSDWMADLAAKHWFFISDVASLLAALSTNLSVVTILVFVLLIATVWILWHTSFGLRLRSCGENPHAAESLGINVYRYKYAAVIASGAFAGLGGGFLALVSSSGYSEGQTNGRGYIGLAAMIFGNWRPGGILLGSGMFGYTDSLRLRDASTVHALLLLVAIALAVYAVVQWRQGARTTAMVVAGGAALFLLWFALTDEVPRDFTSMTPYVLTLLVLAFASQRLRMPKADGLVYRKGSVG